jgi:hypothetical protein
MIDHYVDGKWKPLLDWENKNEEQRARLKEGLEAVLAELKKGW